MVATAIIGSGLISAGSSIFGAKSAAKAQMNAADQATALQREMFNKAMGFLQPYIKSGQVSMAQLMKIMPQLIAPVHMDQKTLEATPGYKFNLAQGNKAVMNSAGARGLGVSGAALKGAGTFATGLADATYQQQFQNALANKQMAFQSLMGPIGIGEGAAGALGGIATNTGQQIGSNIIGAGNARAASDIAMGNAFGGIGNSLVASLLSKQMFSDLGPGATKGLFDPVQSNGNFNYYGSG